MATSTKPIVSSDLPIHPGEALADELEARQISRLQLAERLRRPLVLIDDICEGRTSITADIAVELEHVLDGISATFWLGLQMDYDMEIARARYAERHAS